MPFIPAATLADLETTELYGCVVEGARILLLKVDGEIRAYEDRCAHLGLPLSLGWIDGGVITCSAHHYQYDARSGCGINPPAICLRSYPVRVEAGTIWVDPGTSARPTRPL